MTPAELKCSLGLLGVSTGWFGEQTGAHPRTVVRWCDGESPIPKLVSDKLAEIMARTEMSYDALRAHVQPDGDGTTVLYTYRTDERFWQARPDHVPYPASWHRQMVARLAHEIPNKTRIEYYR